MATNINLVVQETENKTLLTGKSALVLSIVLVLVTLLAYGAVLFFKGRYVAQAALLDNSIAQERLTMSGPAYTDLFDFQERLTLLNGVLDNHGYWDSFLRDFSKYIIPDVHLTNLSFDEGSGTLKLQGVALNMEVLSREAILLKDYPGAESVEFNSAVESAGGADGESGVIFMLDIKTNPSVFKK
jgi:hypothetical protein